MSDLKPTVISLFTGAGGMDEGFKAAGFDVLACMDIEQWACDTLRANNPNQTVIGPPEFSGNIKQITPKAFEQHTGIKPGQADVLIGGPPCQPFSQAAAQRFLKDDDKFKRKGFKDEEKGTLLFDFIEYIKYFKPKVFVIENVPGLLSIDGGVQLKESLSELSKAGYIHTTPQTLNAVDYGVPQYRERTIIWGTTDKSISPVLPPVTHGDDMFTQPYNLVAHALTDIPKDCNNHIPRNHKPESVARYQTLEFGQREKLGRVDRLDPLRPSKTVIAGGMNGGGRSHLHPYIARTLTVRECARLQTFPDTFVFTGSMARQFTQVGNAVPPLLAEHLGRHIMSTVFRQAPPQELSHNKYISTDKPDLLNSKLLDQAYLEKDQSIYFTHTLKEVATS
jgi:DNA (cytosine-5)-methyltransferase 1